MATRFGSILLWSIAAFVLCGLAFVFSLDAGPSSVSWPEIVAPKTSRLATTDNLSKREAQGTTNGERD